MLVAQALALKRPRLRIRVSSKPRALVLPMRAVSASSSASPQRRTDRLTGCQLHPQLFGHVFYGPAAACLPCRPPARSCGEPLPRRSSPRVLLGGGALRALPLVAAPSAFAPHQPHGPAEQRQIHQLDTPVAV